MGLKEQMKTLECHFNWNIEGIAGDIDIIKKSQIKSEEFSNQSWQGLLVELNLLYELHKRNSRSEAEEKLKKCLRLYENIDDKFLDEYKPAFKHVLLSLKLFVNFDNSSENDNKKLFNEIPQYSTLSQNEKAAIIGIKAYCFGECGTEGRKHSLTLAREAHQVNPNEAEWCFMIGLALSRIRKYTFDDCITDEEVKCIERAYMLRNSPYFAVYLAQTYLDYAKMIVYNAKDEIKKLPEENKKELLEEYNRKSHEMFSEIASRFDEKDVHIYVRCARGLFQLRHYKSDGLNEALTMVEKCLEVAPNYGMCHTLASSIYSELKKYNKALEHFIKAEEVGDYFSSIRKIQLKNQLNLEVNAAETFDFMLKKHPTETFIYQTHLYAISYYIFVEKNLQLAVKHFLAVSKLSTMKRKDYEFSDPWVKIKTRLDLCRIMYNEVRCALNSMLYHNDEERMKLEEACEVFKSKYPDVTKMKIDSKMVENLSIQKNRHVKKKHF